MDEADFEILGHSAEDHDMSEGDGKTKPKHHELSRSKRTSERVSILPRGAQASVPKDDTTDTDTSSIQHSTFKSNNTLLGSSSSSGKQIPPEKHEGDQGVVSEKDKENKLSKITNSHAEKEMELAEREL